MQELFTPSWKTDSDFVVDLYKATYNFEIQIVATDKCRPLLIYLNDDGLKILTKSYVSSTFKNSI